MKASPLVLGAEVRHREGVVLEVRKAEVEKRRHDWPRGPVASLVITGEDVLVGAVALGGTIHE